MLVVREVSVTPDPSALPGGAQVQQIAANGLAAFALLGLVGTDVVGMAAGRTPPRTRQNSL